MHHWRRNDDLLFLDNNNAYKRHSYLHPNICNYKNLDYGMLSYKHFLSPNTNNSPYHNAIKAYMDYCTDHLHKQICFTADDNSISYTSPIENLERCHMQELEMKYNDGPTQSGIQIDNNDAEDILICTPPPYS